MNYYDPEKHHRKSIRLKDYNYSSDGAYFITLVTKNRETFFGEIINGEMILSEIGKIAFNNWSEIDKHFNNVVLDEFVIMPNHVHGVIFLDSDCLSGGFLAEDRRHESKVEVDSKNLDCGNCGGGCDVDCGGVKFYALTKTASTKTDLKNEQQQKRIISKKTAYFSTLAPKKNTISSIIRAYKASVTSNCKKNHYHNFQWQRNYYEHIIRNEKSLNNIRKYIKENTMKWFLDKENEKRDFEKYKFKNLQEINDFEIKN